MAVGILAKKYCAMLVRLAGIDQWAIHETHTNQSPRAVVDGDDIGGFWVARRRCARGTGLGEGSDGRSAAAARLHRELYASHERARTDACARQSRRDLGGGCLRLRRSREQGSGHRAASV